MVTTELLNSLRYKSEGTDLDFKSEQYRFAGGSDQEKSEILKDILAIANAWRDGTGYILLGFKDRRPHLAEVVGITESIDDSRLQQFINSKVKPKLTFRYEEHLYDGKTVGVIVIPKQPRPFFSTRDYGRVRPNVAYVRRGSSTEEAELTEVAAMALEDAGRGQVHLELAVLTPGNEVLPDNFVLKYLSFPEELPDYESTSSDPFGLRMAIGSMHDNRDYWRDYAEFLRIQESLIEVKFVLRNHSKIRLSNAKLEVRLEPLDGQSFEMRKWTGLPDEPEMQRSLFARAPAVWDVRGGGSLEVDEDGVHPICHVRFGSLLPGEEERSSESLCVLPQGPGRMRLHFRILAEELATPQESERILTASGELLSISFGDLDEMHARALIAKYEAGQQ